MKLPAGVQKRLLQCIDGFFKMRPQPFPGGERLKKCKIIAHRGEHDNRTICENTLAAFDLARERGVWGIEFDVRWTKDLHPVVLHDPDLERVFNLDQNITTITRAELSSCCPAVPSLAEVVQRYGRKLHLMVELKAEAYPDPGRQNAIFKECFAALEPQRDYHLLSLAPHMFDLITFVPTSAFIPVAMLNLSRLSELAVKKGYGGVAGHYLLINKSILAKHRAHGQKVGTGYPASKNCLFREINRGVEWIFSNNAGELQSLAKSLIKNNQC